MNEKFYYRLVLKKDTAVNWTASDYVALEGEPCFDTTNNIYKIGNGVDLFDALLAVGGSGGGDITGLATEIYVDGEIATLTTYVDGLPDNDTASELEKVIEWTTGEVPQAQTGWRILGQDPLNYGLIGPTAIDFSMSDSVSTTNGATGENAVAIGYNVTASGAKSFASGEGSTSSGESSHAEGTYTTASGYASHSEGYGTVASGERSHAEGEYTTAYGSNSHAEGYQTNATGNQSHAEGYYSTAVGNFSHAEGNATAATAEQSHAEGHGTICLGNDGHTENHFTYIATEAHASHAEGFGTTVSDYSTYGSTVVGGNRVIPPGGGAVTFEGAHAEGMHTHARANASHAEGYATITRGDNSHAEGFFTIAKRDNSHAAGMYNLANSWDTMMEVGIGNGIAEDPKERANAFEIYESGLVTAPEMTIPQINTYGAKALTTKEYVDANAGGGATPFAVQAVDDGTYTATDTASIIQVPYTGNAMIITYDLLASLYSAGDIPSFDNLGQFHETVMIPMDIPTFGVQELGGYRTTIKGGVDMNGTTIGGGHNMDISRRIIVDNGTIHIKLYPLNQTQGTTLFKFAGTYTSNEANIDLGDNGFPFNLPG